MTPSARVQAAIEILDLVIAAARSRGAPADRILADWFTARRYAGAKDRRAVRDLVYGAIRACGPVPASGRTAMLRLVAEDETLALLFDGSQYGPIPIDPAEPVAAAGIAPEWLERALAASGIAGDEASALLARAPLDVRINALKEGLADLPSGGEPCVSGHRYPHGTRIEDSEAFRQGVIEVQDAGSQLACSAVGARAGQTILDLCAGAGGKTLALAAAVGEGGRVIASDTDRARLSRLAPRAVRAGAEAIVETRLLDPGREAEALVDLEGRCDAVLVDAPCSGTGTWRRNPESRWRIDPGEIERYAAAQARLLDLASRYVRPGGRLVFVTCSLLDTEGPERIADFLAGHDSWAPEPPGLPAGRVRGDGLRLTPHHDGTDGFFVARLSQLC